jgi:hypothetical protein
LESASRNARRSGAWIRVWGEAGDRRRIGGYAEGRPLLRPRRNATCFERPPNPMPLT